MLQVGVTYHVDKAPDMSNFDFVIKVSLVNSISLYSTLHIIRKDSPCMCRVVLLRRENKKGEWVVDVKSRLVLFCKEELLKSYQTLIQP